MTNSKIDRDAFTDRVLENIQAGRPALDGLDDLLGTDIAREWQALSNLVIAGMEEITARGRTVRDALAELIEENKAAIAARDRGE